MNLTSWHVASVNHIGLKKNYILNSLRPRQDGRHFPDDIFKCIFLNENVWISIKISLKFVSKGSINNIPALVQIMAWRRPGDKPLSEPMMVSLLTHICVTRPQWVNHAPAFYLARIGYLICLKRVTPQLGTAAFHLALVPYTFMCYSSTFIYNVVAHIESNCMINAKYVLQTYEFVLMAQENCSRTEARTLFFMPFKLIKTCLLYNTIDYLLRL